MLTIERTAIDFAQSTDSVTRVFEHKYLRQAGDTVFLYHNDAFRMIYHFGATIPSLDNVSWDDPNHYELLIHHLTSTDTIVNGLHLQLRTITLYCALIDAGYVQNVTILTGIGALNSNLFYYSDYDCSDELLPQLENTEYRLRCYSVNGQVIYAAEQDVDCDRLTDVPTVCSCEVPKSYFLAPNPATGVVQIGHGGLPHPDDRVVVYAADGRKMLEQRLPMRRQTVDVHVFSPGVYYFHFLTQEGLQVKRLVVGR